MGENDATTSYDKGVVTIAVKQTVFDAAFVGDGRARHTLAHELGHAVFHDGVKLARRSLGNVTPKWIEPCESAEHQARVFAAAFLINDAVAETLSNAEKISIEFGISLASARIYFEQIMIERDRSMHASENC
jgi:Zn-dependent peptidase ImmA (M78 family)